MEDCTLFITFSFLFLCETIYQLGFGGGGGGYVDMLGHLWKICYHHN